MVTSPSSTPQRNKALGLTILFAIIAATAVFTAFCCLGVFVILTPVSIRF